MFIRQQKISILIPRSITTYRHLLRPARIGSGASEGDVVVVPQNGWMILNLREYGNPMSNHMYDPCRYIPLFDILMS